MNYTTREYPQEYPLRTTVAEIDLERLRANFRAIVARGNHAPAMPVIKADAYGHGIVPCAEVLVREGAQMLGVAFAAEAEPLRSDRRVPYEVPIAVVTPPFPHGAQEYCRLNLEFCAASMTTMQAFSAEASRTGRNLHAHLTIDTGMHRDGIQPHEALEFMRVASALPNITIHGVCTHFATADEADKHYFHTQVERFRTTVQTLRDAGFAFRFIHAANSGAVADSSTEAAFTLLRPGIALYGYNPSGELTTPLDVKPVMSLKTSIISLRRLSAGEPVSYGRRYTTPRETTIATIPIGYADGLRRNLTGKARVMIGGQYFPIVGTICMDQCMVDIGDADFQVGETVQILGSQKSSGSEQGEIRIDANDWAQQLRTIPYEILTGITARVPRIYVNS
ncbi:MAG: alanine racemase [Candidatus Kapabacteria bacterium]|jgi:alanine racemase|nr:alanine racemase [Candidatus Kapabacteria bacterium]